MKHTVFCVRTRSPLQMKAIIRFCSISLVKSMPNSQPKFEVTAGSVQVNCSDTQGILSSEEQIAHAETLFVLKSVQHDHSFRSSDDLVSLLRVASNDPIVNGMTLGASKISYIITYGIVPYYHELAGT